MSNSDTVQKVFKNKGQHTMEKRKKAAKDVYLTLLSSQFIFAPRAKEVDFNFETSRITEMKGAWYKLGPRENCFKANKSN